ncbi:hypothetical protein D9619_003774 [Psilocybe cf. subviscida]|uniref:NAD-dependent epimerase/dehydratase domain-containing protein n=1 Tax=Psilocybe cf. subviscida TaxID=2480587 RepID=A0A8H5ETJ1_9AGAR|nr:hypothetical protein D9619_003774 [Psilocybe cf. subviscida]
MPTIPPSGTVLVSGSNGYIAMWVVRTLLERGYRVRGTVRTEEKIKYMREYFEELGYAYGEGGKLELVVVEDIVKEGAFDEAVKGVDGVVHMASPLHFNAKDPQDLYRPAIQGTVGMLKSVTKNGPNVQRIVITSSFSAIMTPPSVPTTVSEADWNTTSEREVDEQQAQGALPNGQTIYRASKKLAESSAWEFYENIKSEVKWDLTTILPPFAFGPPIHDTSLTSLNASLALWYVVMSTPKPKELLAGSYLWIDVRDVALAHVLALEEPEAGGERIIVSAASYVWQEWLDALSTLPSNLLPSHQDKWQRGFPEICDNKVYMITVNGKQERVLGIKYRTAAETARDTLVEFARRGW